MGLTDHLGMAIVDEGVALIEQDAAIYGSPAAVAVACDRMFAFVDELAAAASADPARRRQAHKLGELIVGVLHGGDRGKVTARAMADVVRAAPVVDLRSRVEQEQKRQDQGDEIQRRMEQAISGQLEGQAA
jgi:hypothetical protein